MRKLTLLMLMALLLGLFLVGCRGNASTSAPKATGQPANSALPAAKETPVAATGKQSKRPEPASGRPLAQIPPTQRADRWSEPPAMHIDPNKVYLATIETDKGLIVAELYAKEAPQSVNNFVTLANLGFYDGLTFHRVEPGFVIQGGDPLGNGSGGPGYTVPAEIGKKHLLGALAYARTGDQVNPQRRSSGSQFYITLAPTPFLDGAYTVFGQVVKGMSVVQKIAVGDKIKRITITETDVSKLPTPAPSPTPAPPKAPEPSSGRPLSALPLAQKENLYNRPPATSIDLGKQYQAIFHTEKGDIQVQLWPRKATEAVNNFVVLANLGYYDNFPFNFVQEGQLALTGSPGDRPSSDIGYSIMATTGLTLTAGSLGVWVTPASTSRPGLPSGSQIFIALADMGNARNQFPSFGQVIKGMDVAKSLRSGDMIKSVEIVEK